MKQTQRTTTKQVTSILYTHEDLITKLGLPAHAQFIVTPPKDYDEGILILNEDTGLEAEYIIQSSNTVTNP